MAASLLLRAMVVFALSMGRSKRYRYAAEHLRQCERLEARIDDLQGFESHASFMGRLRGGLRPEVELLAAAGALSLRRMNHVTCFSTGSRLRGFRVVWL